MRPSRIGPIATALAVVGVLILLAYGLLVTSASETIDNNLAEGRPTPAPVFELPILSAEGVGSAPEFRLPRLSAGRIPAPLRRRLAPDFLDGALAVDELRGTPVVLNFWASWCVPCREEAPILQQAWRRDSRRGILYLGLNMQDLTDDAKRFLSEFAITYPTIRDQGDDVAREYGATGIPETYFIDRDGRVVGHVVGVVTPELLSEGVRAAIDGRVVGTEEGGARRPQR